MKKIGLLGGTFDPPHIGHFIIAQEVKNELQLDEIWFIPTNEAPHKAKAFFSAAQRFEMLRRVTEPHHGFSVEPIELNRQGKSYTIDTIHELRQSNQDTKFYFIIGADMVEYLAKWRHIDKLIELVQFVGVGRPNYSLTTTNYPVTLVQVPLVDISSTKIREKIKNGLNVKFLLPHEVYIYIKEQAIHGFK